MKYQDEICNSGYLHGIIESRFSESDDPLVDMQTMCDEYPQGSFLGWQCYHGTGHGVMYYTANDLPRSLEMCDTFGSSFAQADCSNGVLMENFAADQKLHLSEFLKKSDGGFNRLVQHGRFSVLSRSEVRKWRGWVVLEACLRQASRSCGSDGGLENPSAT